MKINSLRPRLKYIGVPDDHWIMRLQYEDSRLHMESADETSDALVSRFRYEACASKLGQMVLIDLVLHLQSKGQWTTRGFATGTMEVIGFATGYVRSLAAEFWVGRGFLELLRNCTLRTYPEINWGLSEDKILDDWQRDPTSISPMHLLYLSGVPQIFDVLWGNEEEGGRPGISSRVINAKNWHSMPEFTSGLKSGRSAGQQSGLLGVVGDYRSDGEVKVHVMYDVLALSLDRIVDGNFDGWREEIC